MAGQWAVHSLTDASVEGNSGIPDIGENGGVGYHYGKTADGRPAAVCPRQVDQASIKLQALL